MLERLKDPRKPRAMQHNVPNTIYNTTQSIIFAKESGRLLEITQLKIISISQVQKYTVPSIALRVIIFWHQYF